MWLIYSALSVIFFTSLNLLQRVISLESKYPRAPAIAEATKVIPIVQTSILATVILGILLLKEKENISKKIIAGVAALAGVILLV